LRINSAKDLEVYKKAYALAIEIFEISKPFPKEEKYDLTGQIRRSSRSVGLNLREAWAMRLYVAHFISKLTDCDGENSETESSLDFAIDSGYLSNEEHKSLTSQDREIIADQLKLFGYVGKNIIKSPSYINQSILDKLGSFASRYMAKKSDYYSMFDYYRWDEKEIENLIINEYQWETAIDTKTTWRIGDGTAGFYNYVYYTVAGFSEYDTFRSNQIREGMLTREEALKLVIEENKPRYESIKWYLEIIGLDFETVIKKVNQIPKLY
jgi:four helix bundle protein